jgi:hypothetical protein
VRDERSYSSCDLLRTRAPLIDTEVYDRIEYKCQDDRTKYLHRGDFVAVIASRYPSEPEDEKHEGSPEYYGFSCDLYESSIFWSDESTSRYEKLGIEREERLYHSTIVSWREVLPRDFRRKD